MSEKEIKKAILLEFAENEEEFDQISKMAQKILRDENNIKISSPEGIATIAYVFIKCAATYILQHRSSEEDVTLNFLNLFDFGVTYRESEDGEKEGNFTPFMQPRVDLKMMFKDDDTTEDND